MVVNILRHLLACQLLKAFGRLFTTTHPGIRKDMLGEPHGADDVLGVLNVSPNPLHEILELMKLTELTVNSNMETRAVGFKPYIAPALSSGAISLIETLKGGWNYSSVYFGAEAEGAFFGCRNKRTAGGIEIEDIPLCDALYERIRRSYDNLCELSL